MRKAVYFVFVLVFAAGFSFSQKLYFCEEYTGGKEIGVSETFIIKSGGGYFTCMLDLRGTGETVKTKSINLKIEKYKGSSLEFIADEKFDVQSEWDYIFFDKFHTFYDEGKYKVTAFRHDDTPIASGDVTIELSGDNNLTDVSNEAKLYFCSKYEQKEIGISGVFYISVIEGGTFTAMLDLRDAGKKVDAKSITLRINKLAGSNEIFVADEKFDVDDDWDYIYFSDFHNFKSAGKYKVRALKPDGFEIAAGNVEVRIR